MREQEGDVASHAGAMIVQKACNFQLYMMYHVKSLVSRSKIRSSIRFYRAEKLTQRLRDSNLKVALKKYGTF